MKLLPVVVTTLAICSLQVAEASKRGRKKSRQSQFQNDKPPTSAWIQEHSPCQERTEKLDPTGTVLKRINKDCFFKGGQCHVRNFKNKIWKMNEDVDHHVDRAKAKECLIVTRKCCMRACVANTQIKFWKGETYCHADDVFDLDMVSNYCQTELTEKCGDGKINVWEFIPGLAKQGSRKLGKVAEKVAEKVVAAAPKIETAAKAESPTFPILSPIGIDLNAVTPQAATEAKSAAPKPASARPKPAVASGSDKKWRPYLHHNKNPRTRLMNTIRAPLQKPQPRSEDEVMAELNQASDQNSRVSASKRTRIGIGSFQGGRIFPGRGRLANGLIHGRK